MVWLDLFFTFFRIGLVSFGGGYAMVPLMQQEAVQVHDWLTVEQFADTVAIAGMSPGPIATNMAIVIGFQEFGWLGSVIATLGIVMPSLLIILLIGMFFARLQNHPYVQSAFYGLRATITGLILYAAFVFAVNNNTGIRFSWFFISQFLIFAGSLLALLVFRKHPMTIIIASGLVGIALYS